ncbi:hypothetical protein [Streptomyces sp. NPDC060366]|uniref:hypothetical protein n=1 Tax=Streptomyces sp. NPDC060366 TaxID=3347105 RepID=UPI0036605088
MSVRRTTATAPQGEAQVTTRSVPTQTWTRAGDPRRWQEAVYDHQAFGDERLSLVALGVFARVMDLPVGTVFSAQTLASLGPDSPEAGQAGLDELAAASYLTEVAQ